MPYDFFLELLYPLPLRKQKMFGVDAFYLDQKILFALRKKATLPEDNGIWLASKVIHHPELYSAVSGLQPIQSYGIKSWLVLPETLDTFEEQAGVVATLIKTNSILIGNIPIPKKRKKKRF